MSNISSDEEESDTNMQSTVSLYLIVIRNEK